MKTDTPYIPLKHQVYLFAGILMAVLVIFVAVLRFNGLYGQDAYEYLRYFKALKEFYHSGTSPGDMVYPMFYPFLATVLPGFIFSLQLVSILAFCISFILVYRIIELVYSPAANKMALAYLLLFYFLSPYVFRFSVLVMSDMLSLLFCVATVYYCLRYLASKRYIHVASTVLFALCAVFTRTGNVGLVAIPVFLVAFQFLKQFNVLQFLGLLGIVLACALPDYFIRHKIFIYELGGSQISSVYLQMHPTWSILNWFRHSFQRVDEFQTYAQPNIVHVFFNVFHPAYLFAGIIFCFFMRKPDFSNRYLQIIAGTALFYALFLAGLDLQNMRYLLPAFPLVVVFFYPAFQRIFRYISGNKAMFALSITGIIAVQLVCTGYSFATVFKINRSDKETAEAMKDYPGKTVYALDLELPMRTYGVTNPKVNIYDKKLDTVLPNALALVDTLKMRKQFTGQNPEINWLFIKAHSHPVYIKTLTPGLDLFELQP